MVLLCGSHRLDPWYPHSVHITRLLNGEEPLRRVVLSVQIRDKVFIWVGEAYKMKTIIQYSILISATLLRFLNIKNLSKIDCSVDIEG
jgi:hypothetical protein